VVKEHHAVVHDLNQGPFVSEKETPALGERGMLSPIRVKPCSRGDKMHVMARINFARTYTVEHNVKVYDFGNVVKDDLTELRTQWSAVIKNQIDRAYHHHINTVVEEDDEEEDE